ncbi:MAG: 2-keto-4-pentenoate hydratase [Geminicoccales bacterium]
MTTDSIERAARILSEYRLGDELFAGLPADCRPGDMAAAYRVQDRLHERLRTAGRGSVVAHKIGCTTEVMQSYLGIHNPCAGGIPAKALYRGEADLRYDDFRRVGVECEIAILLGDDLTAGTSPHDRRSVAPAVAACMAAIEIVDDRYVDYRTLDTPTLIADDFFNAGAVLGATVEDWQGLDLAGLEGRMRINDACFGSGLGADILGHPLNALAWLANALNARKRVLRAGQIVLLGSVVQTQWLGAGDVVEVEIDRLGGVKASFS